MSAAVLGWRAWIADASLPVAERRARVVTSRETEWTDLPANAWSPPWQTPARSW